MPLEVLVVPSLQVTVAPAAGAAGAAAGAAAAGAAVLDFAAAVDFCTPPWPLQVPLPVEVVVVPSLQVVGVVPSARTAPGASANNPNDTAIKPLRIILFMRFTPLKVKLNTAGL